MPFYSNNTITEDMLKRLVSADVEKKIDTITNAIMDRYKKLDALGIDGGDDEVMDTMYEDRNTIKNLPMTVPVWHSLGYKEQKKWITKLIDAGLFKPAHGDGFHWLGQGYRNEHLWFWDKKKGVIPPCSKYDDYGSVPDHFLVGNGDDQFLPDKWQNIVDHNSYVFLAPELVTEIKTTAKKVMNSEYREIWHTSIVIQGVVYAVHIQMKEINNITNVFSYENGKLYKDF